MKKYIKSIPVYLTVVVLLCSMLVFPAFASASDVIDPVEIGINNLKMPDFNDHTANLHCYAQYDLIAGTYIVSYGSLSASPIVVGHDLTVHPVGYDDVTADELTIAPIVVDSNGVFVITEDMYEGYASCAVFVNSYLTVPEVRVYDGSASDDPVVDDPVVDPPAGDDGGVQIPLYSVIFDFFANLIYGVGADLSVAQNYVLTFVATIVCLTALLLVVVVPFLILLFFLRLFR